MSLSGTVIYGHSTSKRKTRESSTYSSANGDILDEASSALATRRLLVYTLSKVLTERELFPVTCFKNSELRPDLIAQVFKGPQQTSIMEKDVGEHAIKCLKALNCVISRMSQSPNISDLIIQLFDVKNPQIVYEEWRFEITCRPPLAAVPDNKKRGDLRSGRREVLCSAESFLDIVGKALSDIKNKVVGLKLFDFNEEHQDARLRLGVTLAEAAVEQNPLPKEIFEQEGPNAPRGQNAGSVVRWKVGVYDLPFHGFSVKVKSTMFNGARYASVESVHKKP